MARHPSLHLVLEAPPRFYTPSSHDQDQDAPHTCRAKATARDPQEIRRHDREGRDGAREAHAAEPGEEGQEEGAGEAEKRRARKKGMNEWTNVSEDEN
jgi:hypothetical protein